MNTLHANAYTESCLQRTRLGSPNVDRTHLKTLGRRSSTTKLQAAVTLAELMPIGAGKPAALGGWAEDPRIEGTTATVSGFSALPPPCAALSTPPSKSLMVPYFILPGVLLSLNRRSTL